MKLKSAKKWRYEHKEHLRIYNREYNLKNKEKRSEYYQKNKTRISR